MIIYFGIGTNLGNRDENIREALRLLDAKVGTQMACSSIFRSKPQGFVSDNEFANIVVAYQTEYTPEEILHITQQIEQELANQMNDHIELIYKNNKDRTNGCCKECPHNNSRDKTSKKASDGKTCLFLYESANKRYETANNTYNQASDNCPYLKRCGCCR